jgi:UDP-N-acetylglucosamine 2-epimerase (non-hydrolysing)
MWGRKQGIMRSVMTIYGTRPEAIKMAPLISALRAHSALRPIVAVTGQHREMLDQVNTLFDIVPEFDMDLMTPGASLSQITTRVLTAASDLLGRVQPDVVVVQGDTSSAFAAALAAFYHQIPVVHLEAGLRTGNIYSPFPEEANRRLTAPISALHLAPTSTSRVNLEAEGINSGSIVVTGNTVIDALHIATGRPVSFADPKVTESVACGRRMLLVTCHRRESWGEKMSEAMSAVRAIAEKHTEVQVILPMHRNAIVREVIEPQLAGLPNVLLTEPLDYHEFAHLLKAAHVVLTDSGGVQEEAPSLGKPVLVMRDTTERPEAVEAGTALLVGTDGDAILRETLRLFEDEAAYAKMANAVNPYGDGSAAARSVAAIAHMQGLGSRLPEFNPIIGT